MSGGGELNWSAEFGVLVGGGWAVMRRKFSG